MLLMFSVLALSAVSQTATETLSGTIIKGTMGIGTAGACLMIQSGAKIETMGMPAQPIIFTSIRDSITCDRVKKWRSIFFEKNREKINESSQ